MNSQVFGRGRQKRWLSVFILQSFFFLTGILPAFGAEAISLAWSYAYDAEGRITEIQSPAGDIHYEYSPITGRKTATWTGTDPANAFNRTEYTYDPLGRLEEVRAVRCNGAALAPAYVTRYDYNKVGSVETITYPNGFHSVYEYNALNRLTELTHFLSDQPDAMMLSRYEYGYYADGMRACAKETLWNSDTQTYDQREVQWKYDNLNRVTEEHLLGGYTLGFVYDLVGNCLRRTLDGTTTYFFYNERDELLKESLNADGSSPTAEYEYDANGSLTRKIDHVSGKETVYEYNLQNRLASVSEDGQAVAAYLYHPEGYRLGKQAGGTMVWYLSDPYNPTGYVQVLEEVTESHTTTYFLGLHVLGQMTDLDDPMFYLPDGQGSTRQTAAAVTTPPAAPTMAQMHYDAYGKLVPGALPPGTNMLYRNQRYDPQLKMYDLRRREYDPSNMRFTQHDPWSGSIDDPMSLHRYLYCNANPINYSDPSGMCVATASPTVDIAVSSYVQSQVNTIRTTATVATYKYTLTKMAAIAGTAALGLYTQLLYYNYLEYDLLRELQERTAPVIYQEIASRGKLLEVAAQIKAAEAIAGLLAGRIGLTQRAEELPIFFVFQSITPHIYQHDKMAISLNPWWIALQYLGEGSQSIADQNRKAACAGMDYKRTTMLGSLDEYPFASTYQGGAGASVEAVPSDEQTKQGQHLSAFYRAVLKNRPLWFLVVPLPL